MKLILTAAAMIILCWIGTGAALTIYDNKQKQEICEIARNELGPGDSDYKMNTFMSKHTERYHKDDKYQFRYSGIVKQSRIDRFIFNRMVQISLIFDPITGNYKDCLVSVSYTSP